MLNRRQLWILSGLLLAGGLIALKLLHIDYMVNYSAGPYQSFCNINALFNCDAVAASPYSHFFGLRIALLGTVSNFFLLAFLWLARRRELLRSILRPLYLTLFVIYGTGCLVLAGISFFLTPSICILCMIFWTISWVTLIYLWAIAREYHHLDGWQRLGQNLIPLLKSEWPLLSGSFALFIGLIFILHMAMFQKTVTSEQIVYDQSIRPYFGDVDAPLELTLYSDFQCPACKMVNPYLERLAQKYGKKVRFVRKEFPLDHACNRLLKNPNHVFACRAAYYAKCAGQQGHFWELHNALYEHQEELSDALVEKLALQNSINVEALKQCVEDSRVQKEVTMEIEEGIFYKLGGTPAMRLFAEVFIPIVKEADLENYIQNYPEMPVPMLNRYIEKQIIKLVQFIDTRPATDYKKSHLQQAISWDVLNVPTIPKDIDKTKPTLLYDSNGSEVAVAYKLLKEQGFSNLMMLKGGWEEWQKQYPDLYIEGKKK